MSNPIGRSSGVIEKELGLSWNGFGLAMDRRKFLQMSGLAAMAGVASSSSFLAGSVMAAPSDGTRIITLAHIHTGEKMACAYRADGRYLTEGLASAEHLLRDHRSGESHAIDPDLLDTLHDLAMCLNAEPDFDVISGYRSPATNAELRRQGHAVASRSYHMEGKAVDIRLAGVSIGRVHRAALDLKRGGVGFYSGPGFIHIDTGPVRSW